MKFVTFDANGGTGGGPCRSMRYSKFSPGPCSKRTFMGPGSIIGPMGPIGPIIIIGISSNTFFCGASSWA